MLSAPPLLLAKDAVTAFGGHLKAITVLRPPPHTNAMYTDLAIMVWRLNVTVMLVNANYTTSTSTWNENFLSSPTRGAGFRG